MVDEVLTLLPSSTATGLLELIMIHETRSPLLPGYDKDQGLRAMRLMRQCIENRTRHPALFGAKVPSGFSAEYSIMKVRKAFADFADAPDLPLAFMRDANQIITLAHQPTDRRYRACYDHVKNAITAATEPVPPTNVIKPNLYYWRTEGHKPPDVPTVYLVETVQGNTSWGQANLKN